MFRRGRIRRCFLPQSYNTSHKIRNFSNFTQCNSSYPGSLGILPKVFCGVWCLVWMHLQKMPWAKIFLSSWPNTSWTLITESTRHQIWLWCICWLCTVVNSYIEIEFDVNYSFARYNKDSSVFVLGAACCQQIQIHQKFNIKLNLTFGTFSGICPRPINKAQSPFAPDCFLYKLDII